MEHLIELTLVNRGYQAAYLGEVIGKWRVPECSAARWLLEHGYAQPSDILITTWERGARSMSGKVGWFAKRTIAESEKAGPRWSKFHPDPRFSDQGLTDGLETVTG